MNDDVSYISLISYICGTIITSQYLQGDIKLKGDSEKFKLIVGYLYLTGQLN